MEEFPQGTPNNRLREYEEVKLAKTRNSQLIDQRLQAWNPNADPHIKDTDPYKTIFIGRLPYDLNEIELQKHFARFGEIEKIRIVKDKITQQNKGYAFIVFKDPISSKMAFKEIGVHRGIQIKDRVCIVDIERGRTVKYFKPRRLGGGLGGRGYSHRESRLPGRFAPASAAAPMERIHAPRPPRREPPSSTYNPDRYSSATSDTRYHAHRPLLACNRPHPHPCSHLGVQIKKLKDERVPASCKRSTRLLKMQLIATSSVSPGLPAHLLFARFFPFFAFAPITHTREKTAFSTVEGVNQRENSEHTSHNRRLID